MALARHRRRRGLRGLPVKTDYGSPKNNILFGAALNIGGNFLASRIPMVGGLLARIPVLGSQSPGLVLAAIVAGYNMFIAKKKSAAMDIALGAGLVSSSAILAKFGLGLVTTDMGAVVPTVEMSDGSVRALGDGGYGEVDMSAHAFGRGPEVYQGGIIH